MATDPAIQKFIRERQDTLTPHFESGNIPEILKVYDEDLSFSDHGKYRNAAFQQQMR